MTVRRLVLFLLAITLFLGATAVVAPGLAAAEDPQEPIEVEYAFTLEEGEPLNITITVTIPETYHDRDGQFDLNPSVTGACSYDEGFHGLIDGRWDGESHSLQATCEADAPLENAAFGGYDTYTSEAWAFGRFGMDPTYVEGDDTAQDVVNESHDSPAFIGEYYSFVGEHEVKTTEVAGKDMQLVVPEEAEMTEDPEEVLDSLAFESRNLRIGGNTRAETVSLIATPDPIRGGGAAFRESGNGWASEGSTLSWNTWGHEYVHTRQQYTYTAEKEWLVEGEARYYQYLMGYKQGHLEERYFHQSGFDAFQNALQIDRSAHENTTLTNRSTWAEQSNYEKGALVIAALDADIREATDGERTYQDVMRQVNQEPYIDLETWQTAIEEVAGESMDEFIDTYVTDDGTPHPPADGTHFVDGAPTWETAYAIDKNLTEDTAIETGKNISVGIELEHVGQDPGIGIEMAFEDERFEVHEAANGTVADGNVSWSAMELGAGDQLQDELTLTVGSPAGSAPEMAVAVSDEDGSATTADTTLKVVESPTARAAHAADAVTEGEAIEITADVEPGSEPIATYHWDLTGDGTIDETTEEPLVVWEDADPGVYAVTVVAEDAHGFADRATTEVIVTDIPQLETEVRTQPPLAGVESTVEAAVDNEIGEYSVRWTLPDGEEVTGDLLEQTFETGEHEVQVHVEDTYGAQQEETLTLTVTDRPVLEIEGIEEVPVAGEPVELTAIVDNDIGTYQVTWELPDGTSETGESLSPALEAGEHALAVTVTDEFGATTSTTVDVLVTDEPAVDITVPEQVTAGEATTLVADIDNDIGTGEVTWHLPDGSEETGETIDYTFKAGVQNIEVTVTDEYGAATTASVDVDAAPTEDDETTEALPGFTAPIAVLVFGVIILYRRVIS